MSFAVVNCRVKTLNCEDQRHGTTSEVHSAIVE
ncbi:cell division protein FtsZ, partial [Escherichia coli]|nr:cell division protein FtsZ [Escherichia coli]